MLKISHIFGRELIYINARCHEIKSSASDAVDGSSTSTSVPWMWALLMLPRFRGATHADDHDNRFRYRQVQVMRKVQEADLPLSLSLGILGLNGLTAYFGLLDVCRPKSGETVAVSTAAGGVGSAVGQIAKIKGCRTIGFAGGPDKVRQCVEDFGYDHAIDYKATKDVDEALAERCPDGIDAFFDNTSGAVHDAVLRRINLGARIAICGTASYASWDPWNEGPRPERHLLVKRAIMQGFLTTDFAPRYEEGVAALAGWIREGRLQYREDVLEGIEAAPASIAMLYAGENRGKLIIRL
jgi:NADPH-dependent curcumin reductase